MEHGRRPASLPDTPLRSPASAPPWPALRVRTLGLFAVWRGDEALPPAAFAQRKVALLFTLLLQASGLRLPRERLAEALWPEAAPEQAAARVRGAAHRLRQVLGAPYLLSAGELLVLDPAPGQDAPPPDWCDALAFERAAQAALAGDELDTARAALGLYGGAYLPEERAEDGARARRTHLRATYHALLLHTAALAQREGHPAEAERLLATVLEEEPAHEEAALALMRLLAGQGRPADALRAYERVAATLGEELGLDPGPPLQDLRARLLVPSPDPAPPVTAPAVAPAPRAPLPVSSDAPLPGALPVALSSFVGRRAELATLRELLRGARLLALIGPGGVGKTRLALALAHAVREGYPGGTWFVDLSPLAADASVAAAVARALGVREEQGQDLEVTLTMSLRARPDVLLLLDNAEQVLDATAALTERLLAGCARLRVLVTSRVALGLGGETRYAVPGLAGPADDTLAAVERSEAARLVVERGRQVRPGVTLEEATAPAVAALCRQLDGLPLALELAAARLAVLSLPQVVARLADRFALLTGGSRGAPARQRTLRAALDWSYELLGAEERAVLRRLSVFAGGCTLEAAEAVCADVEGVEGDNVVAAEAVLDRVAGLVGQSLVRAELEAEGEGMRYGLLETVRAYALERLAAAGEGERTRRRHAEWALALAEAAEPELRGANQQTWLERLEREHDNLRAALRWCQEQETAEGAEVGLRLGGALWRFWEYHGHVSEGRGWLEGLLARAEGRAVAGAVRAAALNGAGNLVDLQGDYQRAEALYAESLALRRVLGDRAAIAASLNNLGIVARERGDYDQAEALHAESLALRRALGDPWGIATALNNLGLLAHERGDYDWAEALHTESLAIKRTLGDTRGIATSLNSLGTAAHERGDDDRAEALHNEGLALSRELGDTRGIAYMLTGLGDVALARGDHGRAEALLGQGLALLRDLRAMQSSGGALGLESLARVALAREQGARAGRLLGAVAAVRAAIGMALGPRSRAAYERVATEARQALGADAYASVWAEGHALPLTDLVDAELRSEE